MQAYIIPLSVQNNYIILKSVVPIEVSVLVVPTNGKLCIQKTLFKITIFWGDIVLTGNHLSTF
jgi:hypothetical protein